MGIMMIHRLSSLMLLLSASMGMLTLGFGCNAPNFDPKLATRPYPFDLHTTDVVPIQVFRDGTTIEIVNSTDRTWSDATIWVNQRYAAPLKSLQPGQRVSMDLFSFRDDIGEQFRLPVDCSGRVLRPRSNSSRSRKPRSMPMIGMISIMTGENE